MESRILEGTWEEIAEHAEMLTGRRVRVTILGEGPEHEADMHPRRPQGQMRFGMFKGIPEPTEEDFRTAEFHGDADDALD